MEDARKVCWWGLVTRRTSPSGAMRWMGMGRSSCAASVVLEVGMVMSLPVVVGNGSGLSHDTCYLVVL